MKSRLVQLGCFDQPMEGWENFDLTPHLFISRIPLLPLLLYKLNILSKLRYEQHKKGIFRKIKYLNISKKLPFKDNSVDAFFSSHVIEHLYYRETKSLLKEIYRCLKSGGYVRTVLPSLSLIMKKYNEESPNQFLYALFENGNSTNYKNFHKWMYTEKSFSQELINAGFNKDKVKIMSYKQTDFQEFIRLDNRPENSIYIEAQK